MAAVLLAVFSILSAPLPLYAGEAETLLEQMRERLELYGFVESRVGARTGADPDEKALSMAETRLQVEAFTGTDSLDLKYRGDIRIDAVAECVAYETREAWAFSRPSDSLDIKVGRQTLTWGTGGLVFLNDLFPKDWQSFFIGRDAEYLKAPSTSAKAGLFSDVANLDIVYTPKFEPDRFVNGEYLSYWDASRQKTVGNKDLLRTDTPDRWFVDDEFAARLYRNVEDYELAAYLYRGFWKSPGGTDAQGRSIFPELNAYGASIRGTLGAGIGNLEFSYYHSPESRGGRNPSARNSEIRYLAGYAREVWSDCNVWVQYYLEQMLDYGEYRARVDAGKPRDEFRHVLTLQVTQLLMNQNLTLNMDAYYSPSDRDAFLRPSASYKISDRTTASLGANVFFGESRQTFFGQFERNSNVYMALRYSF
ncbi:hypothetical protein [Pseudodesulfovibrio alkaliphilus]|nr:hypothetical protein [Pseudodesulfovibrio alkaliphilus]